MVSQSTRVAIIGGGMGGLTAAIALTRIAGVEVTIFEQASKLGEVGAGVTVAPNAQRVLDVLGVLERVRCAGAVPDGHGVYQGSMGELVTDAAWEDSAKQYRNIGMYRPDLIDVLASEVAPATIRLGHKLAAVHEAGAGVRLEFENGVTEEFDAVVGADGIHSVVRRSVGQFPQPVYSGYIVYRGVVDASRLPADWPMISQVWMGDQRHFMCYPLQQRKLFNFVAGVPSDRPLHGPWSGPAEVSELAAEYASDIWDPQLKEFISAIDQTFWWGLFDHEPLTNWSRGPIVLLGDAAHTMLPHQGQGVNQAIEDSMALATFLKAAKTVADIPEAFRRYTAVRMQRTAILQHGSRRSGWMFDAQHEFTDLAKRDADLRVGRDFRRSAVFDYDAQKVAEQALARFEGSQVA
ncbi:FAD-dependent oxidoreductase [Leucobacter chromiireducens]|uniref:2-polyprenyl-6-methoxyphenol hydroxylase n=1 Tax=Leucobacter chromiireducens subsp. chromiireducens TaxID=660067 RepID=A0ABS1SN15_9MICO|nr:FAD-dependent monooxygenase [Leucobacter chromiireducens]MBL3689549.1 2-polyprenyl-6-methoxyphenol hydroxylase [Leucobacter chromiireducens subsp. chromiireducens]